MVPPVECVILTLTLWVLHGKIELHGRKNPKRNKQSETTTLATIAIFAKSYFHEL